MTFQMCQLQGPRVTLAGVHFAFLLGTASTRWPKGRLTIPPRAEARGGGDFQERLPTGGGTWDQTTGEFAPSSYISIAVEYHDILLLNNPTSSLLITNRYHSSRMNNLRGKKSLNKSRLIAFLKKSNFLMFLMRAEQQHSQRINYLFLF